MSKFTPGPWVLAEYKNYTGFSIHAEGRGCIAERWYPEEQNTKDHGLELVANARLITFAPKMYEFISKLVLAGPFISQTQFDALIDEAGTILSKAEGA